jgi:hypothetical protein
MMGADMVAETLVSFDHLTRPITGEDFIENGWHIKVSQSLMLECHFRMIYHYYSTVLI